MSDPISIRCVEDMLRMTTDQVMALYESGIIRLHPSSPKDILWFHYDEVRPLCDIYNPTLFSSEPRHDGLLYRRRR